MRTTITLFFAMFISMSFAQVNLDFETATPFTGFDGGTYTQVANPSITGINTSAQVGKLVRSGGAMWAGCKRTVPAINFSTNNELTMMVYTTAPVGTKIVIKIENGGTGAERAQFTTATGEWQKMTWNMRDEGTNGKDIVIMPGFGAVGNGTANSTFYFDNIKQEVGVPAPTPSGTATLNFEPTGLGQAIRWSVFENGTGTTKLGMVANPSVGGVNPSATVAYIAGAADCQAWLGAESAYGDVGPITWSTALTVVKVKVYSSKLTTVAIKMGVNNVAQRELRVPVTAINTWQELTFDFTSYIGQLNTVNMNSFTIHPSAQLANGPIDFYFDDVTFTTGGVVLQVPTVAAPTPTKANADVLAIMSDLMTSDPAVWTNTIAVTDWVATGNADASFVMYPVAGNMTHKMASIVKFGIGNSAKNIAAMKTFHIDIWTPNISSLTIALNGVKKVYTPAKNTWISYDIDLTDFGSPTTLNANGIEFEAQPFAAGVLYYDNVYFYKLPSTGVKNLELSSKSVYPNPVIDVLNIQLSENNNRFMIYDIVGNKVFDQFIPADYKLDMSNFKTGIYFLKAENAKGIMTGKVIKK
jgi:hypothetical protein